MARGVTVHVKRYGVKYGYAFIAPSGVEGDTLLHRTPVVHLERCRTRRCNDKGDTVRFDIVFTTGTATNSAADISKFDNGSCRNSACGTAEICNLRESRRHSAFKTSRQYRLKRQNHRSGGARRLQDIVLS